MTNPTNPADGDVVTHDQALRYVDILWSLPPDYKETKQQTLNRLRLYIQQRAKDTSLKIPTNAEEAAAAEPIYQMKSSQENGWSDCSKATYETLLSEDFYQRRILYTTQQRAKEARNAKPQCELGNDHPSKCIRAKCKHLDKCKYPKADPVQQPRTINLDKESWLQIQDAAFESKWMPPEYFANDWLADVCKFLREGPASFAQQSSDQGSGEVDDRALNGALSAAWELQRMGAFKKAAAPRHSGLG